MQLNNLYMKKKTLIVINLLIIFTSCSLTRESDVIITKDYVINPYWDSLDNSISISRMKLKDSTVRINLDSVTSQQLLKYLEEDTTFSFISNVHFNGESYSTRKVFFHKDNGFLWSKQYGANEFEEQEVLDSIEQKRWYLIYGLGEEKTIYYFYIDEIGNLHTFKIIASDWTNI